MHVCFRRCVDVAVAPLLHLIHLAGGGEEWREYFGRKSENSKLYFGHGKGLNKYLLRESKEPHAE